MTDAIRPQPGIMAVLYQGGAATIAGVADPIKLSSNENPFGPSDKAREAYAKAGHKLHRYPSTDHAALRTAIGEVHGLDPAHHLWRRLGRDHPLPVPGLCRPQGRGGLPRTRVPDVPHLGAGRGGDAGRGARTQPHRRCRCAAGGLHQTHAACVPRQPRRTPRARWSRWRIWSGWRAAFRNRRSS